MSNSTWHIENIITNKDLGIINLYIFDKCTQQYICTNKIDLTAIEDDLKAAVDSKIDNTLDNLLDKKVPTVVKTAMESQILYGGNSTATDGDYMLTQF